MLEKYPISQAYEQFLELPVPVVFAVMWVAGAVLEGSCVVALYEGGLVLAQSVGAVL